MHLRILFALALPVQLLAQAPGPVVFSEIMWMGSSASNADEWIELYNRSSEPVDLSGWRIRHPDADEAMIEIPAGILPAGGIFLIANYDADDARSMLDAPTQLVDAALSLPNTRLHLRLEDADGQFIDLADDGSGAPLAGDTDQKRSMVRVALDADGSAKDSWATARTASGWDAGATEKGTPGSLEADAPTSVQSASWGRVKQP